MPVAFRVPTGIWSAQALSILLLLVNYKTLLMIWRLDAPAVGHFAYNRPLKELLGRHYLQFQSIIVNSDLTVHW